MVEFVVGEADCDHGLGRRVAITPQPVGVHTADGPREAIGTAKKIDSPGLTFVGGTDDFRFRAFATATGEKLWEFKLPSSVETTPITYLGADGREMNWTLIRAALASVANTVIIPLQDVLGLGSEARMNLPGRAAGNWRWRFSWEEITPAIVERLRTMIEVYER